MAVQVVNNAALTCSFGASPSTLLVVPKGRPVRAGGELAATVQDFVPQTNIAPFGMCTTLSNPQVASATAAAMGALTPQPCIPILTAPWSPGSSSVNINGTPALTNTSTCTCQWGGVISVTSPGQTDTTTA